MTRKVAAGEIDEVMRAIFEPFFAYQYDYASLERSNLSVDVHNLKPVRFEKITAITAITAN